MYQVLNHATENDKLCRFTYSQGGEKSTGLLSLHEWRCFFTIIIICILLYNTGAEGVYNALTVCIIKYTKSLKTWWSWRHFKKYFQLSLTYWKCLTLNKTVIKQQHASPDNWHWLNQIIGIGCVTEWVLISCHQASAGLGFVLALALTELTKNYFFFSKRSCITASQPSS